MQKLTKKQELFVREYLVSMNATQAAIRAGYSKKSATAIGYENLMKPYIAARIEKSMAARAKRTDITQDFVLTELLKIAKANGTDFAVIGKGNRVSLIPTAELPPEKRAAVAAIKKGKNGVEIKTYDKIRALELLGKHLGLFEKSADDAAENALAEFISATTPAADALKELYADEEEGV